MNGIIRNGGFGKGKFPGTKGTILNSIPLIRAPQFFIGQENIANWRNLWLSRHRHHRLAIKAVEFLSASGSGRSARPLMGAGLSTFSSPKIIFMDKWGLSRVEGPPKYADEA